MTTPAQPTQAPATEQMSARDFFMQDDATLAGALNIDMGTERPLDADEVSEAATPIEEKPGAPAAPPVPETVEKAEEGIVELKAPERKLMTEFQVADEEGDLEIPDIKIRFKAKGEQRELPLDHVVRLAQFGFANEEREQQVMAARKFVQEAQDTTVQMQQQISQYETHYDRLFNDPAFYEEARLAYLSQNTPEAKQQREAQQLRLEKQQWQQQQEDTQVLTFVRDRLVPTMAQLITENTNVSEQEAMGRYHELIAPYLVRGRIPSTRLPQIEQLVQSDLVDWVQRRNFERSIVQKKAEEKQSQVVAQSASTKRQAARVFAQHGAAVTDAPPKATKYNSANDWLNSTFGKQSDD